MLRKSLLALSTLAAASSIVITPLGSSSVASAAASRPLTAPYYCLKGTTPVDLSRGVGVRVSAPPYYSFTLGKLPRTIYKKPPTSDPQWRLWFESMRWAQELATEAERQQSPALLRATMAQQATFYRDNPDRGLSTLGWDEGTSLRRLQTLNCLYAVGKAMGVNEKSSLLPLMAKEVAVQRGKRYYGPPNAPVHNHGVMANNALVTTGMLTGRTDWKSLGGNRLLKEGSQAFSPAGFTFEQSSEYHMVNVNIWASALQNVTVAYPNNTAVKALSARVQAARGALQWLTEPDGKLVQLGDATRRNGVPNPKGGSARGVKHDPATGFTVARWSWTDPTTTYLTARSGGRRWAHGHNDKGSLTWSTAGDRILVDPGFSYLAKHGNVWWTTPAAHNVSLPTGCTAGATTSAVKTLVQKSRRLDMTMADSPCGKAHRRGVTVGHGALRVLGVTDSYGRGVAHRQVWHLDPSWKRISSGAKVQRFRSSVTGRILTVTTGGTFTSKTTPVFYKTDESKGGTELVARASGRTVSTVFKTS